MKTKYTKIEGFYNAIDNLIEVLKISGFIDDSAKLNRLMHETFWTTSSELLGELGLALKDMKSRHPKDLDEEINECYIFAVHHRKILGLDG